MDIETADDVIDRTRGAVLAQRMDTLPDEFKGPDANPVNLYYGVECAITGWIEGFWDDAGQEFLTIAGDFVGAPSAWAVLPKTPEDWR